MDGGTDTQAPQLLGRYELIYVLGQGGMGEVHLARIRGAAGFEKLCIVKTILPQRGADPQFIDRFHHEAKLLVQLTHSNIAQVYDMGDAEGRLFMAIEYVSGVDLAKVEGRAWQVGSQIPVPIALVLGHRIAEALGYAHRKVGPDGAPLGIVHRDVSPQNVMVSYEGEVKVIDFGLAKSAARSKHTAPATVMGKLGYMSPEQVRAERVDHRTDIFSCGVVIWEMLAGRPLYEQGTMGEMLAQMANPKLPSLQGLRPEVSVDLERTVARALAPSMNERYARADDFARALNEIAVKEGLSAGSEEIGTYVKGLCIEEFAEQRKLMSKLSLKSSAGLVTPAPGSGLSGTAIRPATPAPSGLSGTAIRPSSQPAVASIPSTAPSGPSPVVVSPSVVAPAQPQRSSRGLILGIAAVVLLGMGIYGGAHYKEWLAPAPPTTAAAPAPPAPIAAAQPAPTPTPAPPPAPAPAVAAAPAPQPEPRPVHHPKHKTVAAKESAPEPTQPAAPQPAAGAPAPAPEPPKEAPAPNVKALAARAHISFGRVRVFNDSDTGWHNCELRFPSNKHYVMDEVPAHDSDTVMLYKFAQDGTARDVPNDHLVIHCVEGAAKVAVSQ